MSNLNIVPRRVGSPTRRAPKIVLVEKKTNIIDESNGKSKTLNSINSKPVIKLNSINSLTPIPCSIKVKKTDISFNRNEKKEIFKQKSNTLIVSQQSVPLKSMPKSLSSVCSIAPLSPIQSKSFSSNQLSDSKESIEQIVSKSALSSVDESKTELMDIEKILSDMGYILTNKFILGRDSKDESVELLKVYNKYGLYIYVIPDMVGNTSIDKNDIPIKIATRSFNIPHSLKSGLFNSNRRQAHGLVFECENGICILRNDQDHVKSVEVNYACVYKHKGNLAFPIFRLSEILANNNEVVTSTLYVTDRIRKSLSDELTKNLENVTNSIQRLYKSSTDLKNTLQKSEQELNSSILLLGNMVNNSQDNSQEDVNIDKLIENLRIRSDKYNILQRNIQEISTWNSKIVEFKNDLDKLNEDTKIEFSNMNKVLT
jgi:hypothetical protein